MTSSASDTPPSGPAGVRASAFIVIVLVTFLLGQREDLRDCFIRLIGAGNVIMTTRLMNEAAYRVSQFLLWQTLINIAFGTCIALGLYWIGVPYAALWGGITAVLRFVPYVGTVLSALALGGIVFARRATPVVHVAFSHLPVLVGAPTRRWTLCRMSPSNPPRRSSRP